MSEDLSLVVRDVPVPGVARLTLNRPEKRNAMSNALRGELLRHLIEIDRDPALRVTVLRGAGRCFCAGFDLGKPLTEDLPYPTAGGSGQWARHVVEGWFSMWDLAKPVIAQVHGYCVAGGTELATACDLVYVAEDAVIGYPPVRLMSPPDTQYHPWLVGMRHAMELCLTGDSITGVEAARIGFANRAYAAEDLERQVLRTAERIARIPPELVQLNKRAVHRTMEIMGMRAAIRAGTELQALGIESAPSQAFLALLREDVKSALDVRDGPFGDYRTTTPAAAS